MINEETYKKAIEWLVVGETGISSRTLLAGCLGISIEPEHHFFNIDTPKDPDDLKRCRNMLGWVPGLLNELPKVSEIYPMWKPFTDNWWKLMSMYMDEIPESDFGSAPKLYEYMQELNKQADDIKYARQT